MSGKSKGVLLVVLGLIVLIGSGVFYTVDQREFAVLMNFGNPVERTIGPGLHVKWPVISTVRRFDSRLRVAVTRPITYVLEDRKPIILQAYLCWKIVEPLPFLKKLQSEFYAEEKIKEIASSALRISISKHPITSIVSIEKDKVELPNIERQLQKDVNDEFLNLASGAVQITRVGINRLALPADNEKAVYDRMKSERDVARSAYIAEGELQAKHIRTEADKEARRIVAEANGQAEDIRGQGEAEATDIYRKAYSTDRDFYRFWHTLKTYEKVFGTETTLVIPFDSEFMKYFRMSEAEKVPEKGQE